MGCIPNIPVTSAGIVVDIIQHASVAGENPEVRTISDWVIVSASGNANVFGTISPEVGARVPEPDVAYNAASAEQAFDFVVPAGQSFYSAKAANRTASWGLRLASADAGKTEVVHIVW